MFLIMSSVIYDHKHGHVLLILMGKIRINGLEFTPTNAAGYRLWTVLGSRAYAPLALIMCIQMHQKINSICHKSTNQSIKQVNEQSFSTRSINHSTTDQFY